MKKLFCNTRRIKDLLYIGFSFFTRATNFNQIPPEHSKPAQPFEQKKFNHKYNQPLTWFCVIHLSSHGWRCLKPEIKQQQIIFHEWKIDSNTWKYNQIIKFRLNGQTKGICSQTQESELWSLSYIACPQLHPFIVERKIFSSKNETWNEKQIMIIFICNRIS